MPLLRFAILRLWRVDCVIAITENGANAYWVGICGDGNLTVECQRVGNLTREMYCIETGCMRLSAAVGYVELDQVPLKWARISYQYGARPA